MNRIFLVIGILLLAGCSKDKSEENWPTPSSTVPAKQTSTAEACKTFIASLSGDVVRDTVDVPEDPNDPASPTLHIFYYGKIQIGKPPVLFVNGGPAEDSHAEYRLLNSVGAVDPLWNNASVLFFDQRGNGCSSGYPQGNSDHVLARLRFYGSSGIVADAEAIRKKLFGNQRWRVIGQSYGGWVAHRYAIAAPEGTTQIHSQANVINDDPIERVTNRIFSQHRVLEEYFKSYPQDRDALPALHAALQPTKCYPSATATPRRCGLAAVYELTQRFPFVPRWTWVHDWLSTMVKNGVVDDRVVLDFLKKTTFAALNDPSNKKDWAKEVIDFYDRNVPLFDRPTCETVYSRLRARGETPENYLLDECMATMQFPVRQGEIDDRNARLERLAAAYGTDHLNVGQLKTSLTANRGFKFFLYSGQLDTAVPVENFGSEVQALGSLITYRNFLRSGHDGYYTEHQIALDVLN
ncbi:MAG: alpha/beta fold hydrolase [Bdellovibrionota bacterium]